MHATQLLLYALVGWVPSPQDINTPPGPPAARKRMRSRLTHTLSSLPSLALLLMPTTTGRSGRRPVLSNHRLKALLHEARRLHWPRRVPPVGGGRGHAHRSRELIRRFAAAAGIERHDDRRARFAGGVRAVRRVVCGGGGVGGVGGR